MLRHVNIDKCDSITHLTWLRHAPLLEYLKVSYCGSIKHVVKEVEDKEVGSYLNDIIFQNLTHIYLLSLPKLCWIITGIVQEREREAHWKREEGYEDGNRGEENFYSHLCTVTIGTRGIYLYNQSLNYS